MQWSVDWHGGSRIKHTLMEGILVEIVRVNRLGGWHTATKGLEWEK